MDYSDLALFQLIHTKMAYNSERQDVLSQNVANIDTPGYKPRDLKKLDFKRLALSEARRVKMRATSPLHITDRQGPDLQFREQNMHKTHETKPIKNSVVLEEQMMLLANNQMEYMTVTNLYNKVNGMFKTAIGNR